MDSRNRLLSFYISTRPITQPNIRAREKNLVGNWSVLVTNALIYIIYSTTILLIRMGSVGLDDNDHLAKDVGGQDKEETKAVGAGGQVAGEDFASYRSSATNFLIR